MQGQLFSTDFLLRGIQETETWKGVPDAELDAFIGQLSAHYAPFTADSALNESQTEDELIEPVIDLLGWNDATGQNGFLVADGHGSSRRYALRANPE